MMIVDIQASEPHFLDHLLPVWNALGPHERGAIYTRRQDVAEEASRRGVSFVNDHVGIPQHRDTIRLVAAWSDLKRIRNHNRPTVLMEHGAGFSFGTTHESYAGGRGRESVTLFLCPNDQSARVNRRAYPTTPAIVVGCPKLDDLAFRSPQGRVVCVSFHWPGKVVPETNWAFPEFRNVLRHLGRDADCEVIGHGHPKVWARLEQNYTKLGIEPVRDLDKALDRCDIYVHDSGSTVYEAAAAGRGVVVMNSRFYRRDVRHGLRFWDHVPGPQVDSPSRLAPVVKSMLDGGWRDWEGEREKAVRAAYGERGVDGQAAQRAVEAIRNTLD